ncbi:MAG: type II secretion system protein [Luteolibacter sp.]
MHRKLKGGFTLVELLVVIVIIAALAGLAAPMVMRQRKKADQTQALSNGRQVGMALLDFDNEYGKFPDASTSASVATNTGTSEVTPSGNSNSYFRQLFAAGITNSEEIFYVKTTYTIRPDNVYNQEDPTDALAAGECGFGYILRNATSAQSASGNPGRPVICAPLLEGSTTDFDPDPFDSRAVILKLDLSAVSINIDNSGKAILNGQDILQTGSNSVWGTGGSPTIVAPEPN